MSKMKVLVMEPTKTPYVKEISHDLHEIVGGYIEPIYFEEKEDAIVYCNDEFLLHDFAPNRFVGEILVHGTFFVVGNTRNDEGEWESCSLTDEQIAKYTEKFWHILFRLKRCCSRTKKNARSPKISGFLRLERMRENYENQCKYQQNGKQSRFRNKGICQCYP